MDNTSGKEKIDFNTKPFNINDIKKTSGYIILEYFKPSSSFCAMNKQSLISRINCYLRSDRTKESLEQMCIDTKRGRWDDKSAGNERVKVTWFSKF